MRRTWSIIGGGNVAESFKSYQSLHGLPRERALVQQLEEAPHFNPSTGTSEFSLRDPDGYYVTMSARSSADAAGARRRGGAFMHTTALIIGISLALGVGLLGTVVGLDRERSFYPVVTIVVASYYALFALVGASLQSLVPELMAFALFLAGAVIGFRRSLWIVALALAAHGVFDLTHGAFITNPGVPAWWPSFCLGYDVTAALYLAALLRSGRLRATT